jgi:hypothetical protein
MEYQILCISISSPFQSPLCWHVSVISALERLRQENCKLGASQSYIARPYLKKKKKKTKKPKTK